MLSSLIVSGLLASGVCASSKSVSAYISSESPIAHSKLLDNIGPDGAKAPGAFPGVVVASPSTDNPNYYYSWIRDSSLVFKTLIDDYVNGKNTSKSLRSLIDDFVTASSVFQQTPNPSGNVSTGGLGEPKFYVNETAFLDSWGRPQRDGPALRSTALITYANYLLDNDNTTWVKDTLWPIIELDVNYVSDFWNYTTFDLWEEVASSSFFTTAVQHRALRQASKLAKTLDKTDNIDSWNTQADNVLCFLQSYWNGSAIIANTGGGRSGIDANTVLASIHTFDSSAGCDATTFQPCSDKALSNLKVYVDAFRSIYEINSGIDPNAAVATGRYPEDVFYDGNPWYLATAAVAEQLYDALYVWNTTGSLEITDISLPFFQQFDSDVKTGTYSDDDTFDSLISSIQSFADGFLEIHAKYTPDDGALSEEFSKTDGSQTSAADLTWSYAAALTAFDARSRDAAVKWGAKGLQVPDGTCKTNEGGDDGLGVPVTFLVKDAETVEGQSVYITGSIATLKSWSPDDALLMSPSDYPTWTLTVNLSASESVQYKYIKKDTAGTVIWESDPNNSLLVPSGGSVTTDDTWR
ncbi:glucoamylase [Punctularia strigosozonata HHB-11173 SS5]|uniref:glucoamylase n=1 Tax=Punctularia strigosozonata (strain HHB-11173) TaxID=741275 RepID=UPI00044178D1|nr:glucoamylase [Punctularia strigosozonata HHB-11173 SS5]EIN12991.1 glucoamylase [Punctularia strigosozonata HHB-11173 SS5]